ncbi:hypothetical protein SAMN05421734_103128 [Pelagirhabdus alkalitolerans]|uniref:LiaI-LiaF-like transmembrane region domain-containing protein n=1 Tax=Pelagirhabdus alkalitolerans TaxID=1612202 RepID=A0A1G6HPX5_9BACI|nr:hypothetical protein [Pelagirhabdus alkalitolerans]SDB95546.1 hypothetical protein SAMN05421734_103128 [Pelagirhabdus alkalitolerans]
MRKQNQLSAYVLIAIGVYFLLEQWQLPIINQFATWQGLLTVIGISLLIHAYINRDFDKLFPGVILVGLGIHFLLLSTYPNWIEHWSVYIAIIGIAFLVRYQKTKSGLYLGLIFTFFGLFMILSMTHSPFAEWINQLSHYVEDYWPFGFIIFGVYLLVKKK